MQFHPEANKLCCSNFAIFQRIALQPCFTVNSKCKYGDLIHECQSIWTCLTYWGRVTHICVGNLTIIGSDNGLSPGRRQAIIWTNAGILLIEPLGTNFSEILIGIQIFSFKKMRLKMSSAKWRPFGLGLNVLNCLVYKSMIMDVGPSFGNIVLNDRWFFNWHNRNRSLSLFSKRFMHRYLQIF